MTALDLRSSSSAHLGVPPRAAVATRLETGTMVCEACGCRLTTRDGASDAGLGDGRIWWHFGGHAGRDARGCTVGCVEMAHHLG